MAARNLLTGYPCRSLIFYHCRDTERDNVLIHTCKVMNRLVPGVPNNIQFKLPGQCKCHCACNLHLCTVPASLHFIKRHNSQFRPSEKVRGLIWRESKQVMAPRQGSYLYQCLDYWKLSNPPEFIWAILHDDLTFSLLNFDFVEICMMTWDYVYCLCHYKIQLDLIVVI